MKPSFLPTTQEEMTQRGWRQPDVILISGDSYIDSPFIGAAVIGRVLENAGFKVGIIAQPDVHTGADITRLGEPRLFWGVTGGSVDSMVANYTAGLKKRKSDDYTPGGQNNRRPDRAVITYANLIRRYFKNTRPIVLGGIEASLRRVAHYDYWSNAIRRSILFDAKADFLLYGMCEQNILTLAKTLQAGDSPFHLAGLCYIGKESPENYIKMPAYETVKEDPYAFIEMFHIFYQNNDPLTARGISQLHGDRYLVQNPPPAYPSQAELDAIYRLPFQRAQHPFYEQQGPVKALDTIRFSINTHRGCYGECNFCAIAVHEGRTVRWRSETSIIAEAQEMAHSPDFHGTIQDVGGPTANMYGYECTKKTTHGACPDRRCLYPEICPALKPDHQKQLNVLRSLRTIPGIKHVFIGSGIRTDLIDADRRHGAAYVKNLVQHHVSGQLKLAPEHSENNILAMMGKNGITSTLSFKKQFDEISAAIGKEQYLTYYLIAAHPGCRDDDMRRLKHFCSEVLNISPEQVQIFTPTPSTYSSLMYYTGINPFTLQPIFVEKSLAGKERQKQIVVEKPPRLRQQSPKSHNKRK